MASCWPQETEDGRCSDSAYKLSPESNWFQRWNSVILRWS